MADTAGGRVLRASSRSSQMFPAVQHPVKVPSPDDSQIIDAKSRSIVLLCARGDDITGVEAALRAEGLTPVLAPNVASVGVLDFLPRVALVETSLAGATEFLRGTRERFPDFGAIAVLGPDEREHLGLAAGATVALRRPLDQSTVTLCVRRLLATHERMEQARHLAAFDPHNASGPLIESVLSALGHEINSPLTAALTNVTCLQETLSRDRPRLSVDERRAVVEDTFAALERIRHLMQVIGSFIRGSPPLLGPMSIATVVERAVVAARSRGGAQIRFEAGAAVVAVANGELLEQVVSNLLQNADEATKDAAHPEVLVRVYSTVNEARVSIRDNGPGVPAAVRERIFEPFFTTKGGQGTGLGLTLVRHAVLRMGGTLSLSTNPEGGACFRVRMMLG